jgi:hypothetical protein
MESREHKARMQSKHSQIEEALMIKLASAGVQFETDRLFCIQSTCPDFFFVDKDLAVYVDESHQCREEQDEQLRELLAKRYRVKVVTISYERFSKQETERVFKQIMEALK